MINMHNEVQRILCSSPVLSLLGGSELERLASFSTLRRFERKADLPPMDSFVMVGFGLVKHALVEREFIVDFVGPGEAFGEFSGRKYTAVTESVTAVYVPWPKFHDVMTPLSAMQYAHQRGLSEERTLRRMVRMFHAGAEARVAYVLCDLLERFGDEREDGSAFVSLQLTRSEMGSLAGVTTETVIRTFTAWKKDGFVITDPKGGFEVKDHAALRKLWT